MNIWLNPERVNHPRVSTIREQSHIAIIISHRQLLLYKPYAQPTSMFHSWDSQTLVLQVALSKHHIHILCDDTASAVFSPSWCVGSQTHPTTTPVGAPPAPPRPPRHNWLICQLCIHHNIASNRYVQQSIVSAEKRDFAIIALTTIGLVSALSKWLGTSLDSMRIYLSVIWRGHHP